MATLSIVIPAYNEEDAIEEIVTRCLAARGPITQKTGLGSVEVVVVDDGSKDRTRERASKFKEAKLISHPVNRGYGAALMTGFDNASGDYLSFLDADGTCDPLAFVDLYAALSAGRADMAVGNRLHEGSKMPKVREAGNRFYAAVISWLTGVPVGDSASGMRVFSRGLLPRLRPLPTGLHFTPAMTARAACMGARIVESPIPYADRQGQSKLNVVADGLRFLSVILGIIFAYFPLRLFGPLGVFFGVVAAAYGVEPVRYYLEHHALLLPDMIPRLLTIVTLTVCGLTALAFGLLAQRLSDIALGRPPGRLDDARLRLAALVSGLLLIVGGIALNSRVIVEYVTTRTIQTPWVYVLVGGLAVISGTVLVCFGVTLGIVNHLPREKPAP
jgi:glycosyltransferase involved in cell wall biosynthesis